MLYYYLTKQGDLKESGPFGLSSYDPNTIDMFTIKNRAELWECLLYSLASGCKGRDADTMCQKHGLNGQDMLQALGRLKSDVRSRKGIERYLIEFLKIPDPKKFYVWLSKQKGVGKITNFYREHDVN